MHLCLDVTAAGHELVARRRDGVEHSRWAVADVDPLQALLDHEAGVHPRARPWLLEALDAAIERQGYRRAGGWLAGVGGPSCVVNSHFQASNLA